MTWQARAHDRRQRARFEIVGRLPGTIASDESLRVLDVSRGGALVESPWPLSIGCSHRIRLESTAGVTTATAVVRRVTPQSDGQPPYLVALEFMAADQALLDHVDALCR
jgi:hypothetical protein